MTKHIAPDAGQVPAQPPTAEPEDSPELQQATAPAKTRTTPGFHALKVYLKDEHFAALESTADGRPLNVWLSKLIERHFEKFSGELK